MQVPLSSALNPRLPLLFRVIASVEWLVLGVTGFGLFLHSKGVNAWFSIKMYSIL